MNAPSGAPSAAAPQRSALFAALFRLPVVVFEMRGRVDAALLHPDEALHVRGSAPKRIAEFASGRACARAALAELSITNVAVLAGADREPLWPAGIVGSITHTGDFCAAAVARSTQVLALGIDAESRTAVRRELWRHIMSIEERTWLARLPAARGIELGTVVFSAKESFFKCQYPLTREWVGFNDVNVTLEDDTFRIHPRRVLALAGLAPPPWSGRFSIEQQLIATALALPSD